VLLVFQYLIKGQGRKVKEETMDEGPIYCSMSEDIAGFVEERIW